MLKSHIFQVLQNDKKYLLSKRKLMKHSNPTEPALTKQTPTFSAAKKHSDSALPRPTVTTKLKNSPSKFTTVQAQRGHMYIRNKTDKSRCSSASSRASNLSTRYNEMRRIQNDNIRMVEKILLVKPTLEKKKHTEFYKLHQELSKRLSRYSQSTGKGTGFPKSQRNNQIPKQNSAMLPDLKPRRLSLKNTFKKDNYYSKRLSKPNYSFV